jgi:hypothetical protein
MCFDDEKKKKIIHAYSKGYAIHPVHKVLVGYAQSYTHSIH